MSLVLPHRRRHHQYQHFDKVGTCSVSVCCGWPSTEKGRVLCGYWNNELNNDSPKRQLKLVSLINYLCPLISVVFVWQMKRICFRGGGCKIRNYCSWHFYYQVDLFDSLLVGSQSHFEYIVYSCIFPSPLPPVTSCALVSSSAVCFCVPVVCPLANSLTNSIARSSCQFDDISNWIAHHPINKSTCRCFFYSFFLSPPPLLPPPLI